MVAREPQSIPWPLCGHLPYRQAACDVCGKRACGALGSPWPAFPGRYLQVLQRMCLFACCVGRLHQAGWILYCIDLMPCLLLNCFPKLCSQLHCLAWSLHGGEGSECGNFREQILRVSACRSVQEDVYQKDNLQRCLTVFQDFDERLLKVLRETDPSTVTEHGLYERSPDKMPDEVIYPSSSARLEEAHRLC